VSKLALARETKIASPCPEQMDLYKIIEELVKERSKLDRIIKVLETASTFDEEGSRFVKSRSGRRLKTSPDPAADTYPEPPAILHAD
jgi:hypothetical protein